ncbi:sulfotransferase family protein [Streptomyces shenzhenensis]|uniref:sulfotransferase family protein n=1 Tax=Streptomyces shenzhenensis TaxID=943815 RepID=UPI0027E3E497|nr:sulfotransferase [Streptomyces shenzhenensis]
MNRAVLAHWITGRRETRFYELGLDAEDVAGRITGGPPTLGSALGIALKAYADSHGKARRGDKRPACALHVEEILRLFPDAQFVPLVRDGRDCVASLLGMPWRHRGFHEAVATWAQVTDGTRRHARRLGPGAWHEVRYEDLITDCEHQLCMICAYLGEEYDPRTTEPHRLARAAVPARRPGAAVPLPVRQLAVAADAGPDPAHRGRVGRPPGAVRLRTERGGPALPGRTAPPPPRPRPAPRGPRRAPDARPRDTAARTGPGGGGPAPVPRPRRPGTVVYGRTQRCVHSYTWDI